MKKIRIFLLLTAILLVISSLTACGSAPTSTDQDSTLTIDSTATIDSLLGKWTDISASERFVKIEQKDNKITYTDNEASYPATFKDGYLTVEVTKDLNAQVYIDEKSGHLISSCDNDTTEFTKNTN